MAKTTTIFLPANTRLTITADAISAGHFYRITSADATLDLTEVAASSSTSIGPFNEGRQYGIVSTQGELTTSQAAAASDGADGLENVVEDTTPQLGGDLDLNSSGLDFPTTPNIADCIDDDTMATASATSLATSESIKAYVDAQIVSGSGNAWSDAVDADIIPDADGTRDLGATATRFAETYTDALDVTNNITVGGTVDGRDLAADGTKLDGIESGATADQTGAEIKAAYEAEADTNAFTDAEKTKLAGIETSATADQSAAEVPYTNTTSGLTATDVQAALDEIDGNVDAITPGDAWGDPVDAVITPDADSTRDLATTTTRFATAYVDDLDVTTNIVVGGTVDGRDVAADGTKLDGIEASADVTDEANVTSALSGATLTAATVATGDKVLVQDADDSDNLKTVTAQSIADLAPAGDWELIASTSISGSPSSVDFTDLSTTYAAYQFVLTNVVPTNDADLLYIRFSTDNGSSFDTTVNNYHYSFVEYSTAGSGTNESYTNASAIRLEGNGIGNDALKGVSGTLTVYNPAAASTEVMVTYQTYEYSADDNTSLTIGGGRYVAGAVDAIRFFMLNATLADGEIKVYGLRAA